MFENVNMNEIYEAAAAANDDPEGRMWEVCAREAFMTSCGICFFWILALSLRKEAATSIQAMESKHHVAQVSRLLSAICDAVVQLDSKWYISRPTPKFASLLLIQNSMQGLKDRSFLDFICNGHDRTRIENHAVEAWRSGLPSDDDPAV